MLHAFSATGKDFLLKKSDFGLVLNREIMFNFGFRYSYNEY